MRIRMLILTALFFSKTALGTIQGGADNLINQVDPDVNIGIVVIDLTTGSILYQRNADRAFIPASNMKLFSDAAALMALGPDYRFKNQLSAKASELKDGVLKGTLYLHLSGDPSFSKERLTQLLSVLNKWNIHKIDGNVVVDSEVSGVSPYPPGWVKKDLAYSYGAPLGPLMIDANRMLATVNPGGNSGQTAIVELSDDSQSIPVSNQVQTKEKATNCGVDFAMDSENNLTVRGCVGRGQWAILQKMAIKNPTLYAKGLIRALLKKQGISLEGQVVLGSAPKGTFWLASDYSKPIAQLMADTLKPSDNLYADSLFIHSAQRIKGGPVNWDEAKVVVKQFLQEQTGIAMDKAILTDGSGLSRNNLLTPNQTVGLLRFLYERFPLSFEYIAALPVSGRDGTLQKRFKKPDQQDLVRAKTGTMTGILSLSGFLYTKNNHTLGFSIFINKRPGTSPSISGRYRYLIDALCAYFLRQKPAKAAWTLSENPLKRVQYQLNPTQSERDRIKQAKWRQLETAVKQALRGQPVTVIFRGSELELQDTQSSPKEVFSALEKLRKKYSFALAVFSKTPINLGSQNLFWRETTELPANSQRVWVIREAI